MSVDFKIITEESFDYKKKQFLSLMLIRENNRYAIEVISNFRSYGRTFFTNRPTAEKAFDIVKEKIMLIDNYEKTCEMLSFSFNSDGRKLMFFTKLFEKKFSQSQIGAMIDQFGLKIRSRINKDNAMSINIFLPGDNKAVGKFMGTFTKKDFIFVKK